MPVAQAPEQVQSEMAIAAGEQEIRKTATEADKNEATTLKTKVETARLIQDGDRVEAGMDDASQDRELTARNMQQRQSEKPTTG